MNALRQIPPTNDVLASTELDEFRTLLREPFANAIIDQVFAETRRRLSTPNDGATRRELTKQIAGEIARQLRDALRPSLERIINASGVVLHTNLGRAPLPAGALKQLSAVAAGYSNLEFDVAQGRRGRRDIHAGRLLQQLLGCEAAIVVNNNAAAVLLVVNTLANDGEVIVSRGEQVEIGESFRIPDIVARSGARLREVGTTNRTRIGDYAAAVGPDSRLLLRVHPSNFRMIGFTHRPSLQEFVQLGRERGIPTYEDLGSGCLIDMQALGIRDEPPVTDSIGAGVDLISFSGDKLMGGPQAGIIAGKRIYVDKVRQNPLFRALRVDKLTIGVLEYVLAAYLRKELHGIPTWKMLHTSAAELKTRAERFADALGAVARPVELSSVVGGGSAPEHYLDSWGVALAPLEVTSAELEQRLRGAKPAVIARMDEGLVVLDFRTIFEQEEEELIAILRKCL